jgi:hypothetical protein
MSIGTLNEGPLHESLKALYTTANAEQEVPIDGFVADVKLGQQLFEIQTTSFGAIRRKLEHLVQSYSVVLVHPIAAQRTIVKLPVEQDAEATRRKSPKKRKLVNIVDELVSIPQLLAHPNFELEVVLTEEEEILEYAPGKVRRRKGWRVVQRRLVEVREQRRFTCIEDLWDLVPGELAETFGTAELALAMQTDRSLAQKFAYCLREAGAISLCGKKGNALQYQRVS